MTGLDKKLSDGRKMPKNSVMTAVGATPDTTYTEFGGMVRAAVGNLKGRRINEPIPIAQIQKQMTPALRKALKLTSDTKYTDILVKVWA